MYKKLRCINIGHWPCSLTKGKIYQQIEDNEASVDGWVRIIDDSGEDYLYPKKLFEEFK